MAYGKIFEKFCARTRSKDLCSDVHNVSLEKLITEMTPMRGCSIKPFEFTTANAKSNPGYPWREKYSTEEDVRTDYGYAPVYDMARDRTRPLWYSFLKREMLKRKKVDDNDIRMILCPPWEFKRIQASFDEQQNEKMKCTTLAQECQVGWCPVRGGLDLRLRALEMGRDRFVTVDYTRYDGTIPIDVFKMVRSIRATMLDLDTDQDDLLKWVNWNLLDKVVLLANGHVVKIAGGNPSGQVSTSIDNCLINTYITAACNATWFKQQKGYTPTVTEMNEWTDQLVYGDDRIGAYKSSICDPPTKDFCVNFFADYFGMWVKPENVKISRTLIGLEFCGMRVHLCDKTETYVGIYRSEKIKNAIINPAKPAADVEILTAKLASARVLCAYDQDAIQWIDEKEDELRKAVTPHLKGLTTSEAKSLWTDQIFL